MAAEAILETDAPVGGRAYIGSAFRIAVDFVQQLGHTAAVKQRVSQATAQMMERPPFPFAWTAPLAMDELQSALSLVGGRQACVELGLTAGRKLGGSMIAPVLRMATSLFGNTPATVLQNLERFYSMVLRGMTFSYVGVSDREAIVTVRAQGPGVPTALFDVTRGNLTYVFELCGINGTVDEPQGVRVDSFGGEAQYHLRWNA